MRAQAQLAPLVLVLALSPAWAEVVWHYDTGG